MTDVICLDDSSDEENNVAAAPAPSSSSLRRRQKSSQEPKKKANPDDVVLLLDDDDDDDDESHNDKENGGSQQEHNSDSDAHFLAEVERAKKASLSESQTKKPKARSNRVSLSQSPNDLDSDSDDSILNYDPGLSSRKKPPAAAAAAATPQNAAMNNGSLSQSSQTSSASVSSAKQTPIVNPYAKKTPTTTPRSTSFLPMENPYSSNKKNNNNRPQSLTTTGSRVASSAPSRATHANATDIIIDTDTTKFNPAIFPIDEFLYPKLLTNSKQYPDLRAVFLLAFWKKARSFTLHSHDRPKLDQAIKKVVALALWPYPLRSLEEFCHRNKATTGAGGSSVQIDNMQQDNLKTMLEEGGVNRFEVPVGSSGNNGLYCSIPEACLVAMYTEIERRRRQTASQATLQEQLASKENWISLASLIPAIDERLHKFCPGRLLRKGDEDGGVAYYTDKSTRSAEYQVLQKLQIACTTHTTEIQLGYIKQHSLKKQVVFELTPLGWNTAQWIQRRVFPSPAGHYRTSHIASLDRVEKPYRDICMGVDFREGGQKKHVLHKRINGLDMQRIPYLIGTLDIGDYAFWWTKPGPDQGKLCPILVERKSIQDLAASISDGRWVNQKRRMYHGQYVFGYDNCRMAYLIEGKEERQEVSHGFIAHRKHGVSRERLDAEINSLESEGFEVIRSSSPQDSLFKLAMLAKEVGKALHSGKLKVQYDFASFKAEVKKIPPEIDFSRLAKDHVQTKRQQEATNQSVDNEQAETSLGNRKAVTSSASRKPTSGTGAAIDLSIDDSDEEEVQVMASSNGKPRGLARSRSESDDEEVQVMAASSSEKPRGAARSRPVEGEEEASANSIKAGINYKKDVLCQSRFKPSKEVLSHFYGNESSDEEDPDVAKALETIRKSKKRDQKRERKRQQEEAEKKSSKKRKAVPRTSSESGNNNTPVPKKARKESQSSAKKKIKAESKQSQDESQAEEQQKVTLAELQAKCAEYGLPKTGTKAELQERLKGPKPPKILLERKKKGEYVPARHDVASTALLVALYLHERELDDDNNIGMTKDELYGKAESLEITKNPFSGGTTQTGPFHYDGWSSMKYLLTGDPALVVQKKHSRYKLTRHGSLCGFKLAEALHKWCHEHNNCPCGEEFRG